MFKYFSILVFILSGAVANAEEHAADYGRWELYSVESFLKYPDFNLYYKGTTKGALYPGESTRRMGAEYNFVAQSNDQKVDVVWSAGTGDIGPTFFTLGKKTYVLEMVFSDILAKPRSRDSVAIWVESEWKSEKERSWFWRLFW